MLPGAGKRIKLVYYHLCIRRIGNVAEYVFAARRIYGLWVLLLCPPQNLVEPVHAPVGQLAVGKIEKLPESTRVYSPVKGRRGAGPHQKSQSSPSGGFSSGGLEAGYN